MKKILIFVLFIVLFQINSVVASPLLETFPEQATSVICFDTEWALKILGYIETENNLAKAFSEVRECIKNRYSIDLVKDAKKIGIFTVKPNGGIDFLSVISGNLNTKKIISMIKSAVNNTSYQNIEIGSISMDGQKFQTVKENNKVIIFYSDEIILFCNETICKALEQKQITFSKAPKAFSEVMEKSNCFLYITKSLQEFIPSSTLPSELTSKIDSLAGYFKEDYINLELITQDSNQVNQLKSEIEKMIKEYTENYYKEFETNKKSLETAFIEDLPKQIGTMYASAKTIDFINNLKIEQNNNNIILSSKAEIKQFISEIVGFAISSHSNKIQNSRYHAKKASCFSNQRILQGAIEMYNMDHSTMMTTIDMETLVKEHYLIKELVGPEPQCEYESIGDLTQDGYINCKFHGNPMNR